ncbi:VOC family protein [Haloferacaceae archaeon DSL9]
MKPRITAITLGVRDFETSLSFYRDGLGWPTDGIVGTEFEGGAVAFFPLSNGLQLALYPKAQIAADANVDATASSPAEFTLGHNVGSKEAVDSVLQAADNAGATVTDTARDRAWGGYSGHFVDPDDHLWEVV